MKGLSPRQQSILNRIIETYIETAQPVGSRSITDTYTEIYRASYSPATVRNEMGQLEELGYLTHPHTSAGRIPTDQGYRYYVDHAVRHEALPDQALRQAREELSQAVKAFTDFAELASQILSDLTQELSVVLTAEEAKQGRPKIFIEGSSKMLEKPEFQDIKKARSVFKALEEKTLLAEWLMRRSADAEVSITIGRENDQNYFEDCSVISTRYCAKGKHVGTIAVVGPRRMRYGKTVPIVNAIGRLMRTLIENNQNEQES